MTTFTRADLAKMIADATEDESRSCFEDCGEGDCECKQATAAILRGMANLIASAPDLATQLDATLATVDEQAAEIKRLREAVENIDANLAHFLTQRKVMLPETVEFLRGMIRAALDAKP